MEFSRIKAERTLYGERWRWYMWQASKGTDTVEICSFKPNYKSEAGALRAGRRWARKHGTIKGEA